MAQSIGADVAKRVVKLARAVEGGSKDTLKAAALVAKDEQLKRMRADSGGDLRLSGVGRNGAKLNVNFKLAGDTATVRAIGPLPLINNDTRAHSIRSRRAGGRRAVINIPGVGFRRSANHPGTSGKDTWQVGRKSAEPKVRQAMGKRTTKVLAQAMKG